jgi:hypothetical protein
MANLLYFAIKGGKFLKKSDTDQIHIFLGQHRSYQSGKC